METTINLSEDVKREIVPILNTIGRNAITYEDCSRQVTDLFRDQGEIFLFRMEELMRGIMLSLDKLELMLGIEHGSYDEAVTSNVEAVDNMVDAIMGVVSV